MVHREGWFEERRMKNAYNSALDRAIARSLERARIELVPLELPSGEPPSRVRGKLGPIEIARRHSGWIADGPLPLAVARVLYKHPVGRREMRIAGRADHPAPEAPWIIWYTARGERVYPVHLKGRFRTTCEQSPGLVHMSPPAIFHDEPTKIGATAYVDLYLIDSEDGLQVFGSVLRAHDVDQLVRPAWWARHSSSLSTAWLAGDTSVAPSAAVASVTPSAAVASAAPSAAVASSWEDRDTEPMAPDDD
ncbi:MAG: hypothetical protein E6J91_44360 [Deltaproteobacteria bacterium]|nr:MAG: hypothetical protein E6J91_44360 [Deltaproteobacteria bacterium]